MLDKIYAPVGGLLLIIFAVAVLSPCAEGQTFKILHSFGGSGDGAWPVGGQVLDGQGDLFGVTQIGPSGNGCLGNSGCGTVYRLKPNADGTWTESVIHAFNGIDAAFPFAAPILDPQGNLYGTADGHLGGPPHFPAVVYQLSPGSNDTWAESILYQFLDPSDIVPEALTFDSLGNVYGITEGGGMNDSGSVFSLDRSSGWKERLLFSFDPPPYRSGISPHGAITFDGKGDLYGATILGGAYNCGVVYKLTRQASLSWKQIVLHDFACGLDGFYPIGPTFGPDGSLYGVTQIGGPPSHGADGLYGYGTVFKLTPNSDGTWSKTTLYAFHGGASDGAYPQAELVFDRAGNIYGETDNGGNNSCMYGCGTVFKLTPSAEGQWTESVLHFFTGGLDGSHPIGTLAIDGAGNLYGTATDGGLYNNNYGGVAWEIIP